MKRTMSTSRTPPSPTATTYSGNQNSTFRRSNLENKTHPPQGFFTYIRRRMPLDCGNPPLRLSLLSLLHFLSDSKNCLPLLLPPSMPSNHHRFLSDPPLPLAMNPADYPPSSQNTSTSPSINGDLQTTIPTYQHNSSIAGNPWSAPHGHGFGLPQSHQNPIQFGGYPPMGGLGGGNMENSLIAELITSNRIMQQQFTNFTQDFAAIA